MVACGVWTGSKTGRVGGRVRGARVVMTPIGFESPLKALDLAVDDTPKLACHG